MSTTPNAQTVRTDTDWRDVRWGHNWTETRRRYWHNPPPWRRRRCFWCRRGRPGARWWASRRGLHLNHLTYRYSHDHGRCPLWALRPMCPTCHTVETWLTRHAVRPCLRRHPWLRPWEHAAVTYAGRWTINLAVLLPLWWIWTRL
jgi:hypothetical protein